MIDNSPYTKRQNEQTDRMFGTAAQRQEVSQKEELQLKAEAVTIQRQEEPLKEDLLQGRFELNANVSHRRQGALSQGVIQRQASIEIDPGSNQITSVEMGNRPRYWRAAVYVALGPRPRLGYHICHIDPSMGLQARIIFKYTNEKFATIAARFEVHTKEEVEAAIWAEYVDNYMNPANLHWGPGPANSSDGAKARALREALLRNILGKVVFPLTIGSDVYNNLNDLETAAIR